MNHPTDLISIAEAALLLACSLSQVRRYVRDGRLSAWRRGGPNGHVLVSQADALALLEPVEVAGKRPKVAKAGSAAGMRKRGEAAMARMRAKGLA